MGNTSPWAATNCRASLYTIDLSSKHQAASNKRQASSFKRQAATFRALPGMSCCSILSSNKSNGAIASVPMRDLLIPLVDRPSHKSDSVRPARGSFSFPKIKASSSKLRHFVARHYVPRDSSFKRQASSPEQQASSFKPRASSSRTLCPS